MSNEVYANGMELACKAADGKTIAAFPDVCLSPPSPPAGPIPLPYPNTAYSSDTTDGSKTVQISGKEVMLKDKSYFKQTTGDEAATKSLGMGVVTHQIQGKAFFTSWSMDVKIEGENVVRHMDMTTHNHASLPANAPPWMHLEEMSTSVQNACRRDIIEASDACEGQTPDDCSPRCHEKQKCLLVPKGRDSERCCKPATTGHHMIEDHWVIGNSDFPMAQGGGYNAAPTVCVDGSRFDSEHGIMHCVQGLYEESFMPGHPNAGKPWSYRNGKESTLRAHRVAFPHSDCSQRCLEAQLDSFYGNDPDRTLNPPGTQGIAQTAAENRLLRMEAESVIDMRFGGIRI